MSGRDWLPTTQQMSDAAQLRPGVFTQTSMRQALGMVLVTGLLAGLLPFLVNWFQAARAGAALPLARLATLGADIQAQAPAFFPGRLPPTVLGDFYRTLAGLDQPLPGWLAAGLSALGAWINWPLHWLALWIVYGVVVMVVAKALGATNTLQRFYAATGYAAVPLLLTGLAPIPCAGALAGLVGVVWALAVYVRAVEEVTGLTRARAIVAAGLPALLLALLILALVGFALIGAVLALVS